MNPPSFRIVIIDDEPPARQLIEEWVNRLPDLVCVGSFTNAMDGIDGIRQHKPDLVFLDIQMPEMTGLDLMSLLDESRPEIILTTAYTQYALSSYEFSVLDYLLKPIPFDRFVKAINKFRQKSNLVANAITTTIVENAIEGVQDLPVPVADSSSIWLREEKRLVQLPIQEIVYIEGLKDYVKVFTKDEMIITHLSIGQAEKVFAPPQFVRVHRSFIVMLSTIRTIDGNTITLTTGKTLQMGQIYREDLKKHIVGLR